MLEGEVPLGEGKQVIQGEELEGEVPIGEAEGEVPRGEEQ